MPRQSTRRNCTQRHCTRRHCTRRHCTRRRRTDDDPHRRTARPDPTSIPVTTWRLEWLRLTRSRRWIALVAVYLVFGLIGPVMAKYMAGPVSYTHLTLPTKSIV